MTLPASFTDARVRIDYADMRKLNRIRKVARANRATVHVQRYAKDAYEGHVSVPTRWDEGRDQHQARVDAVRAAIKGTPKS